MENTSTSAGQTQTTLARVSAKPVRVVVLLGLILLLSGNWLVPLLDRDEPRFAEAAREMRQRHDYLIPYFNGAYRFDKPPLIYWCQAACYGVLGENAFAARLPSAVFAIATALVLLAWGRRLGNGTGGFVAALMFLTCLQVLIHGRLSVADMPMIFFVTVSVWAGWEMSRSGGAAQAGWWGVLAGSMALGFLAKGPMAWLPLGGLIAGRMVRPAMFPVSLVKLVAALVLSILLSAAWWWPALVATKGEFFNVGIGRHVVHRSFAIMEGHGAGGLLGYLATLPLYFLTFFLSFFPWALKFPKALRNWWQDRRADTLGWYLLAQAAFVFVTFSLVRTKLPHYTLLAFPCLALWLALRCPMPERWTVKACAGMTALALVLTLVVFPLAKPHMVSATLWQQVRPYARADMRLAVVKFGEPSLVWEFRQVITNSAEYITPDKVAGVLQSSPVCVVLPTEQWERLAIPLPKEARVVRAKGIDTAGFRTWDLTAVIKPEVIN